MVFSLLFSCFFYPFFSPFFGRARGGGAFVGKRLPRLKTDWTLFPCSPYENGMKTIKFDIYANAYDKVSISWREKQIRFSTATETRGSVLTFL